MVNEWTLVSHPNAQMAHVCLQPSYSALTAVAACALTCCGLVPHPPRAHHQPLACLCCAWTPCRSFACQLSTDFSQGRQLARPCKWYLTLTVGLLGQYIAVPPTAVELDVAGITQMQLDPGGACMYALGCRVVLCYAKQSSVAPCESGR